jgi:periplasmic copper chaperone A
MRTKYFAMIPDMKIWILLCVLFCNLALGTSAFASNIALIAGYASASITPVTKTGAVYLAIVNDGESDDRIVAIATEAADMVHLHETKIIEGVARMRMVDELVLPAKSEISMKPGDLHIMLMGLKAPLKTGDMLKLTLTFEKAGEIAVEVPVMGLP